MRSPISPPDASRPLEGVPITSLPIDALATFSDMRDPESRSVLRSLGLTRASRVRVCKIGDPCIIQVGATRIGLSRVVAEGLYVLPDPGADE
jgi:Fe2+ transport system protein FeoA